MTRNDDISIIMQINDKNGAQNKNITQMLRSAIFPRSWLQGGRRRKSMKLSPNC